MSDNIINNVNIKKNLYQSADTVLIKSILFHFKVKKIKKIRIDLFSNKIGTSLKLKYILKYIMIYNPAKCLVVF